MEQIVLYVAILAALSGFGMGLINLAGPFLKRRHIALPSLSIAGLLRRGATQDDDEDFDLDLDDEDDLSAARDFAESSFVASEKALLTRRRVASDDDELDEDLASVLDEVAEEVYEADDENGEPEEGTVIYTVSAEAIAAAEDEEDGAEDEDEDEDEDGEDEDEGAQPEVQVVAASGGDGDDMMSFFGEAADAGAGAVAAWREDLPDVSIDELLAEARAIRQQIQGTKSNVA